VCVSVSLAVGSDDLVVNHRIDRCISSVDRHLGYRLYWHNGLLLAEQQEGDPEVIQWFAFLHDLERHDDYRDPEHGVRAAMLAREINDEFMRLSNEQLILLEDACTYHSDGHTEHDPTVMICWDADRLDLGRVGIYPDAQYLCTVLAKNEKFFDAAYDRSIRNAASSLESMC
jgi:uncharacterized protein